MFCGNYYFLNQSDAYAQYYYCSYKCEEQASEYMRVELRKRKEVNNEEN